MNKSNFPAVNFQPFNGPILLSPAQRVIDLSKEFKAPLSVRGE